MGQGQGQEAPAGALSALARAPRWLALALALAAAPAAAQFNPFSALGHAVGTALDVRTRDEVAADAEISASASKRLLEDKQAEWSGVTLLVFARRVVLAGAVKSEAAKRRVEAVVREDKRIRSLSDELLVGDVGSLVRDSALEGEINATLTPAQGVGSVNMRWCATGGRVVLMGVARSPQEAKLAVRKVRGVDGVKAVVSHLRVVAAHE
ncbi:MAG TPA: BON domain-containing protein [Burkholderiales bacterium]|nr:BON domain-containing protein [Burkholderiales bacterium]